MATIVVATTLMVLMSNSEMDFSSLWNHMGGFNNVTSNQGTKHLLPIADIISDGNFRSELVDTWSNMSFHTVSLYGMNRYADMLWETEFNFTGTTEALSSWLTADNIVFSTQTTGQEDTVVTSDKYYGLRIGPTSDLGRSWFAVTYADLSFGPMPQVFAARSPSQPFSFPSITDGLLGCWYYNNMEIVDAMFTDNVAMTPETCIAACDSHHTAALIIMGQECKCGSTNKTMLDEPSNCYLSCTGSGDMCGGLDTNYANAYHVQGERLPGELQRVLAYSEIFTYVNLIELESLNITASKQPAFINAICVNSSLTEVNHYTVYYSDKQCSNGELRQLNTGTAFNVSSTIYSFSILKMSCLIIHLNNTAEMASVQIYSPEPAGHIEVPVVAVVGKEYRTAVEDSTTDSTTTRLTTIRDLITTEKYTTTTPSDTATTVSNTTTTTVEDTTTTVENATTTARDTIKTTADTTTTPVDTTTTAVDAITKTSDTTTTATDHTTTVVDTTTTSGNTTPATDINTTITSTTTTATNASTTFTYTITTVTNTTATPGETTKPDTVSTTTVTGTSMTSTDALTTDSDTITTTAIHDTTVQSTTDYPWTETTVAITTDMETDLPMCLCLCNDTVPQLNLTTEELQERIEQIQRILAVNTSELSSTIRRLTSAEDSRPSAQGIGYLGLTLLIVLFGSIVLMDAPTLINDAKVLYHKLRDRTCGSSRKFIVTANTS